MKRLAACMVALALVAGCGPSERELAGTWRAEAGDGSTVRLELKADGEGVWRRHGVSVPLSWERRSREVVWLHTEDGGAFAGRVEDGRLVVRAPSLGEFEFERR
jgi:hypothetical protein